MSSFVVSDDTINKIVSFLYTKSQVTHLEAYPVFSNSKLLKLGYTLSIRGDIERLSYELFDLNVEAVNYRYGEGEAEKFRSLNFRFRVIQATIIEVIKAIDTWKYQCTEGDFPDNLLYQAMAELSNILCAHYVHQTNEYKGASWD